MAMASETTARVPVIQVRDLVTHYGTRQILHGVSFCVEPGEIMVIMGGSGSGKSTLLRHLLALERATSGSIELLGKELGSLSNGELYELYKKTGVAFLVAGDQETDRARWRPIGVEKARAGGDESGDRAFHVGGPAAEQTPVDNLAAEGIFRPLPGCADRHDIEMAGKTKIRRGVTEPRIEVAHVRCIGVAEGDDVAGKAHGLKHRR